MSMSCIMIRQIWALGWIGLFVRTIVFFWKTWKKWVKWSIARYLLKRWINISKKKNQRYISNKNKQYKEKGEIMDIIDSYFYFIWVFKCTFCPVLARNWRSWLYRLMAFVATCDVELYWDMNIFQVIFNRLFNVRTWWYASQFDLLTHNQINHLYYFELRWVNMVQIWA